MSARIPTSITHDEFNEALKPLFDRLGVSAGEVTGDIYIVQLPISGNNQYEIRFDVVAQPAGDPPSDLPPPALADGHPQDDEFAIWTHRITVEVI